MIDQCVTDRGHRINVGAADWQHLEWLEQFYPEDLPEDWQLSFYTNEFSVVLVTHSNWFNQSNIIETIQDQTEPGFRCLFEIRFDQQLNLQQVIENLTYLSVISTQVMGIVFRYDDVAEFKPDDCLEFVAACKDMPVVLDLVVDNLTNIMSAQALATLRRVIHQHDLSLVWHGDIDTDNPDEGGPILSDEASLLVTRMAAESLQPKVLRTILDACLRCEQASREQAFIVEGVAPDFTPNIETMRTTGTMLELM